MNCPECNGKTAVVDRRGVKRRRKCLACGERFSTFEVLADAHGTMAGPKPAAAPVVQKPAEAKPAAPKKKFDLKKQASARRRIEDLRDMAFLDPDYDYIPEKW